ncbi:MAG: polyprenyl synthetase family protein [Candidatus Heimdallarchaeota archaeon]|nr:polyprenyl synthetase family protein [Candidatus Heimdallarchaeota archaeon]
MKIKNKLEQLYILQSNIQSLLEKEMKVFLEYLEDPLIRDVLSYYFNLGGKRMRPTLFYAVSKAFDSKENLAPFSLTLELIHTMSLYHDDIIDNAQERRGAPTAHLKWDMPTALVGGDIFHGVIHKYLIDQIRNQNVNPERGLTFLSDLINDVELKIGTAVLLEMQYAASEEIPSVEVVNKVASEKTAPLFAFSASAAAHLAQRNGEVSSKLYNMGMEMGYAFQLLDDIGDYFPSNKGWGNDLREDRKTPILSLCYVANPERVNWYRSLVSITDDQIEKFRKEFTQQFTSILSDASNALQRAELHLDVIPNNEYKEHVQVIIDMLKMRCKEYSQKI